jgi:hypothetical protein
MRGRKKERKCSLVRREGKEKGKGRKEEELNVMREGGRKRKDQGVRVEGVC